MIRCLLFGVFISGLGCPLHPTPPVNPPAPVVVDAGADTDASPCNVPTATQDKVTGQVVNACMAGKSIDPIARAYDVLTVRCVAADLLLDLRGAPNTEACVGDWLRLHGGAP